MTGATGRTAAAQSVPVPLGLRQAQKASASQPNRSIVMDRQAKGVLVRVEERGHEVVDQIDIVLGRPIVLALPPPVGRCVDIIEEYPSALLDVTKPRRDFALDMLSLVQGVDIENVDPIGKERSLRNNVPRIGAVRLHELRQGGVGNTGAVLDIDGDEPPAGFFARLQEDRC